MQFVVLGLLLGGPMSVYDIHKRFESVVSLFYSASLGSIQRSVAGLTAHGLIAGEDDAASSRKRRVFHLRPAGRAAWRAWMLEPLSGSDVERTMLAKVFFLDRLDDADDRRDALALLRARLDDERRTLGALADELAAQGPPDPAERYRIATLDYGRRSVELADAWLRELEAEPQADGR